jgi:hypothetical protein
MTTKKVCSPKKQPKKVVSEHMTPTPEQIRERAAEIRAGWVKDCGAPQRGRGIGPQGSYRISSEVEVRG